MKRKTLIVTLCLLIIIPGVLIPSLTLAADPTSSITVTKYSSDGTTVLVQVTKSVAELEADLPIQGDGTTRYYLQGPTFDPDNLWDPDEIMNVESRDMGRLKGTAVRDLCGLVGGASAGDEIQIQASDGFNKTFDYDDVYLPEPELGEMVVCWYNADFGGYVPEYGEGMRLAFFAATQNGSGMYVYGNWDMHETLAEPRWHYFYDGTMWPSSGGLSVKYIDRINIFSSEEAPSRSGSSASLSATANVILPVVGIELNHTSVDYGNLMPGQNSGTKTVIINNTGTVGCDVSVEIKGDTTIAQDFYERSLFIQGTKYNLDSIVASIAVDSSKKIDTQLRLPPSWNQGGEQKATFIFWAEAQ